MRTNNRYLGKKDDRRSYDESIPSSWFNPQKYEELKSNCRDRRIGENELELVSRLFPEFSFCAKGLPADHARLIDIEIRFPSKTQDMIDCLFLTPGGMLVFVEVKRSSNNEARGRGGDNKPPAVAGQLQRYSDQLTSDETMVDHIKEVYTRVGASLQALVGSDTPLHPIRDVYRSVPLLIVGQQSAPSTASREVWQRDLLAMPPNLDGKVIVVDGRDMRTNEALHNLFKSIDDRRLSRG